MVDIAVKSGAAWVCSTQEHCLANILRSVHITKNDENEPSPSQTEEEDWGEPVLLEQTEEDSPCVLTLSCSPCSPAAITRLLVFSEARTMEVYSQAGEYCGTVRGERDSRIQPDGSDRGPFYRKQLVLEEPCSACEVKLLSLAGRRSILVCGVLVVLQQLQACPSRGPGIDMEQVQCLVKEMGTSLSPGAQNLMDMVQFQQKNQTGSLGNLLPLLMGGGVFSGLAQGDYISPPADSNQLQPQAAHSMVSRPVVVFRPEGGLEALPAHNGATNGTTSAPSPDPQPPGEGTRKPARSQSEDSASHARLAEMMSLLLNGQGPDPTSGPSPDFLPMLQSVCGQVTRLRLDNSALLAEKKQQLNNGSCGEMSAEAPSLLINEALCGLGGGGISRARLHGEDTTAALWDLDPAMERRLDEMEQRLMDHVDRRMDALEQKLEKVLLSVLPQLALSQETARGAATGSGTTPEPAALAPASH